MAANDEEPPELPPEEPQEATEEEAETSMREALPVKAETSLVSVTRREIIPARTTLPTVTPSGPPASFEEAIFGLWRHIQDGYMQFGWQYRTDPESRAWMIKNEERLYDKISAWTRNADEMRRRVALRNAAQLKYSKQEYVEWLNRSNEHALYERGILFHEHEHTDWGATTNLLPFYRYFPQDLENLMTQHGKGGKPTLLEVLGRCVAHNKEEGTTTIVIDGAKKAAMGLTGLGKSTLGEIVCAILDGSPDGFHIIKDTVFKKDLDAHQRLFFDDEVRFAARMEDEAEWFFDRRRAMSETVVDGTHELMSKRYKQQYDIFILPSIFVLDERLISGLAQWRFRVLRRGFVEVFRNNNEYDPEDDQWGEAISSFDFPKLPDWVERVYKYAKHSIDKNGTYRDAYKRDSTFRTMVNEVDARHREFTRRIKLQPLINPRAGGKRAGTESTEEVEVKLP